MTLQHFLLLGLSSAVIKHMIIMQLLINKQQNKKTGEKLYSHAIDRKTDV